MGLFDLSLAGIITRAIVFLVAMDVHEFAHAYVAHLNGDDTAKSMGRMSLNPMANINWIGYAMGVFLGFGFLGSAPVVAARMRNPRWGMFQAIAAGPLSNLMLAAIFAVPLRLNLIPYEALTQTVGSLPTLGEFLFAMIFFNILLFVFNLIPLFPLDGWRIVLAALPAGPAVWWERNQTTSMYLFYGLIALSFLSGNLDALGLGFLNILNWIVGEPTLYLFYALVGR
jgi:Zn-dependent protease